MPPRPSGCGCWPRDRRRRRPRYGRCSRRWGRRFSTGEEPGAANVAKLAGNFLIAANLEAMSEAFAMAEKQGVERAAVADLLAKTLFACPLYQSYGKAIAEKRFTPVGFRMPLGLKDLELTL